MGDAPQIPARPRTVGATLKQHREARKLAVRDVAAQMRLDPRVIESLETDNFDALPAALYIRGYLRGYAKILNLEPEALVAAFDGTTPTQPPEITRELKHPVQRTSNDRPVKAVTYLVTLTLVLLVAAWWQSSFVVPEREPAAEPEPAPPPPPGLSYPITIVRHPDGPFFRAPIGEPEPETAAIATAAAAPDPAADSAPAGIITDVAGGPDRVRVRFSEDSWIEVFDAAGNELHMGLARAGEIVDVGGQAPFSVLLGYAPGATLEFNGRPFDPSRYSRSGVARFQLPD